MKNPKTIDANTTASEMFKEQSCGILNLSFKKSNELNGVYLSDFRKDGCGYITLNDKFKECLKVKGFRKLFETAINQCPISLYSPTLIQNLYLQKIGELEPYEVQSAIDEEVLDKEEVISNLESIDQFVADRLKYLSDSNEDKNSNLDLSNISFFPAAVFAYESDFSESLNVFQEVERIIGNQAVEIAQLGEEGTSCIPFSELKELEELLKQSSPLFELLKYFGIDQKRISAGLQF